MPIDTSEFPTQQESKLERKRPEIDPVLDRMLTAFETSMRAKAGNPDAQRSTQALFGAAINQWARDSVAWEQKQTEQPTDTTAIPEISPVLPPMPPTPEIPKAA